MRHVLALDQGTTSSRAIVFDETGAAVASAQREFKQHYPEPGWVEHDPDDLFRTQRDCAREALRAAGLKAEDILAAGIANQRETTLLWDRQSGRPLHRAIVWQDRRTTDACKALRAAGHEATFRDRTGLVLDPYFSGTKIAWILDHAPGARARAEKGELAFGTIDSWLVWRLCAGAAHVTDVSNASRTLLFDLHAMRWDDGLARILGVPPSVLPEARGNAEVYARTKGVPGLPDGIPISGMAGDQQAALFGQACFAAGEAKSTYGTGSFLLLNTGTKLVPSTSGLLTTVACDAKGGPFGRATAVRSPAPSPPP